MSGLALNAVENLVDDECLGHVLTVAKQLMPVNQSAP
jgi:hypothetical protein